MEVWQVWERDLSPGDFCCWVGLEGNFLVYVGCSDLGILV